MKNKKSCVLIVENLPLPFDRRVWQEANALKGDGWQVSAICPKTDKCPEGYIEIDGIHIYRHHLPVEASGKMGFILEYSAALFHEFRLLIYVYFKHGFQVIQGCNPPDLIFIPAMFFKLFGKKYVFDHHDICPELFAVKFGKKGALHKALLFFEKLSYRWSNAVITANDTFRDLCVERTGVSTDKVTAVYSVPDKKNIHRVEARTDLHQGKKLLIGYIGIIGNQDGVDHMVEALAKLKERGLDDFSAVIIGDGPDLDKIKALAKDLNVADHITFTGYLTGEDLLKTLSAIDIGVIPDPFNEYNDKISMNKVFEYSKLGIPIVSYPLTETKRLLKDALEVSPSLEADGLSEAIAKLFDDTHRKTMGYKALKVSEESFLWEHEKEKYVSVFNGLISKS
ncbi:MAG: glycosyltransferase family 4 protein [Pseudomonadota bacterium]